jgi:hypothetical protein
MIEQPLITNDPMGLAKLVVAIVLGTGADLRARDRLSPERTERRHRARRTI